MESTLKIIRQHSKGYYPHSVKDVEVSSTLSVQDVITTTNLAFADFNTRLLALGG